MSKAAVVIRQSQGTDDSISLERQRERVPALAEQLADEYDKIDFGNHTGFSIHTKDVDEERIDAHPEMLQLVEDLRAGEYDYLCAWDDHRIARDDYFAEIQRACKLGGCEFAFIKDVPDDDLTHGVTRQVETHVKKEEIKKGIEGHQLWRQKATHVGAPPKGLRYTKSGDDLEPDKEFEDVMEVFDLREQGATYREIEAETGVRTGTISRILDRGRDYYEQFTGG